MAQKIYIALGVLIVVVLVILGFYFFPSSHQTQDSKIYIDELSGEWWMVAGISPEKKMGTCIQYKNKINSSTAWMQANITSASDGIRRKMDFEGKVNGSSMMLSCPLKPEAKYKYEILSLDSKYAVMFASSISPKTEENAKAVTKFAIVLSRDSEVSDTQFEIFKKQLSGYFDDMTRYVKVDNSCKDEHNKTK